MSNLLDFLFPDYDQTMALHKKSQERARLLLAEAGFQIGETVYLDGKYEGRLEGGWAGTDAITEFNFLTVQVSVDGKSAAAYTSNSEYGNSTRVMFPCSVGDFTKERLSEDNQKRYDWFKKRRLQRPDNWREIPLELMR